MFFMSKENQAGMSASTPPPGGGGVLADITGDVGQGPTAPAPLTQLKSFW